MLVALTGLRRSEALGLRWTDVDLPHARVSVRQVIVKVGSRAVVEDAPKSEHAYRAVDIGPKLVAVLRAREAEQLEVSAFLCTCVAWSWCSGEVEAPPVEPAAVLHMAVG